MKRGDLIIVGLITAVALVGLGIYYLWPWQAEGATIVIEVDGEELQSFPLSSPGRSQELDVTGTIGITTVRLEADRVRVVHSDCPDKICVHTGWIDRPGIPIACLPNRVIIFVQGQGDLDFNTR